MALAVCDKQTIRSSFVVELTLVRVHVAIRLYSLNFKRGEQNFSFFSSAMDSRIIICGAGFSGICMGIKLLENGFTNFTILESATAVGGTWRDNTYPGAACDIMSHLYSFSFYQNPKWSETYSGWHEIKSYLNDCVDKFGLRRFIEFDKEVVTAKFCDEPSGGDAACWLVEVQGEAVARRCRFFISAAGPLSRISIPKFKGMDRFKGPSFHTGRWRSDVDLSGKRVAIVGTGASAIQIIPEIVPLVKELTVFQRTASWVLPKGEDKYPNWMKSAMSWLPPLLWLSRLMVYVKHELITFCFLSVPSLFQAGEIQVRKGIAKFARGNDEKRRLLTPAYAMGCKRVLLSNTYLPAMCSDKVTIVPQTIDSIDETGVVTVDGKHHDADVIIFATGFQVTDISSMHGVVGTRGVDIRDAWRDGGQAAYYGSFVHGYPNFFMLLGPNSGLGTNSVVFMSECQVNLIVRLLKRAASQGKTRIHVRQSSQVAFNTRVQSALKGTLWLSGCSSWYLDKHGRNTSTWPYSTLRFWLETAWARIDSNFLVE